jgi:hypothetical protein
MRAIAEYLLTIDLTNWNPRKFPITDVRGLTADQTDVYFYPEAHVAIEKSARLPFRCQSQLLFHLRAVSIERSGERFPFLEIHRQRLSATNTVFERSVSLVALLHRWRVNVRRTLGDVPMIGLVGAYVLVTVHHRKRTDERLVLGPIEKTRNGEIVGHRLTIGW